MKINIGVIMLKNILTAALIIFCLGFIGCRETVEPINNTISEIGVDIPYGTYTVITYGKTPIDDYLEQGYPVPQYLEVIEGGKVNKIFINTWGEFTLTRANEWVFTFKVEEKYYPVEFVSIHNIKISENNLEGAFSVGGSLIDPLLVDFIAVRD